MADNYSVHVNNAAGEGGRFITKRSVQLADGSYADAVVLLDPSGEEGGVGAAGIVATANFTPAAAAYSAGDIMDVSKEFAFTYATTGLAIPTGALIRILTSMVRIGVTAVPSGQTSYSLPLFDVTQPAGQADNAAFTVAAGDLASYWDTLALGAPADIGDGLYVKTRYQDFDVRLLTSSLWGRLVTVGAHTAAAVARQVTLFGIVL